MTPSTVVCVIEAMKIFNEIQAECSGVITEVLVQNQQPVEWGQVLFNVDPTGNFMMMLWSKKDATRGGFTAARPAS